MSSEESLGICEYLSPRDSGFSGTIKERFSDFNVYEIDPAGKCTELGGKDAPVEASDGQCEYGQLSEAEKRLVGEEEFKEAALINSSSPEDQVAPLRFNVTPLDKEKRKLIHLILKRFPQLNSNTVEKEGEKFIIATPKSKAKEKWPRERPKFLHFSLFKENTDTADAIFQLSTKVRTPAKYFGYAGTKDRRGRTLQRVSVSMVSAEQMRGAVKSLDKLDVGNFSYEKEEIKLGCLAGNTFQLAIRNLSVTQAHVDEAMQRFRENGFINYFGTQRFGTTGVPTHHVGKALLKGNYDEAIQLILQPREGERNVCIKEARKIWAEAGDAEQAYRVLRKGRKDMTIEGKLLLGLSKAHANDKVGALEAVPRPQRQMYCHAFQSFLWNKVVSRRVARNGLQVLEGDLVRVEGARPGETWNKEESVKHISDGEVGDYGLTDVLVPVPGSKVKYPDNVVKDWFREALEEEGLDMSCFDSLVKDYNLPGDYRHIVVKAGEVEWRIVKHQDHVEELLPSPRLANRGIQDFKEASDEGTDLLRSLLLSFSLPSSTYATMALREIMKVSTDQTSLKAQSHQFIANSCPAADVENEQKIDEDEVLSKMSKPNSASVNT